MPVYRYRAISASGAPIRGEMEAEARDAVIDRLRALGHLPVAADEVAIGLRANWLTRDFLSSGRVRPRDIASATRGLAILLRAGVPLDHALELLTDSSEGTAGRNVFGQVQKGIQSGLSLADALATQKVFPRFYVNMVRAGETGDTLAVVLARLADYLERLQVLQDNIRSALVYPIILLFMAGLSVVVLLTVVLPEFRPLLESSGAALPLTTQILLVLGDALEAYWWLLGLSIVGLALLVRGVLRQPAMRQRWDRAVLRIPLLGELLMKLEIACLARTLGMLLGNGLQELAALAAVREVAGNRAVSKAIENVATGLRQGQGLSDALTRTGLFPRLCIRLIRVGEESGRLEEMLVRLADIYDREAQRTIDRMLALLVPALTIMLGLLVAGIVSSVIGAILSLNETAF